jgi:hypothetical protein
MAAAAAVSVAIFSLKTLSFVEAMSIYANVQRLDLEGNQSKRDLRRDNMEVQGKRPALSYALFPFAGNNPSSSSEALQYLIPELRIVMPR